MHTQQGGVSHIIQRVIAVHQNENAQIPPDADAAQEKCRCPCHTDLPEEDALLRFNHTDEELQFLLTSQETGYGFGNAAAIRSIQKNEAVLDLGSGAGFDCFLARIMAGKDGLVVGVDMAPAMIRLSRSNLKKSGYTNVEFRLGEIEHLPVADNTMDIVLSNCVVNLCADKKQVFDEAFRVLKAGGRICFCDFLLLSPLPQHLMSKLSAYFLCIEGAVSAQQMRALLHLSGFTSVGMRQTQSCLRNCIPYEDIETYIAPFCIEAIKPVPVVQNPNHRISLA